MVLLKTIVRISIDFMKNIVQVFLVIAIVNSNQNYLMCGSYDTKNCVLLCRYFNILNEFTSDRDRINTSDNIRHVVYRCLMYLSFNTIQLARPEECSTYCHLIIVRPKENVRTTAHVCIVSNHICISINYVYQRV